jgi:hypothetical protein
MTCGVVVGCNRGERRWGLGREGGEEWSLVSGSTMWGMSESPRGVGEKPTLRSAARAVAVGAGVGLVGAGWAAAEKMSASWWMASI